MIAKDEVWIITVSVSAGLLVMAASVFAYRAKQRAKKPPPKT